MGLGFINKFYLTNIYGGDSEVFLSVWKPIKKEDGNYYWPPNTPIGGDLWVNNCIGLEEGKTVFVKIVRSKVETGIWLCCSNGDFLNEQWIYNHKHKEGDPIKNDNDFGIHVNTDIEMVDGDDPIPISFEIISDEITIKWNNQIKLFLIHLKNVVGNFLGIKE